MGREWIVNKAYTPLGPSLPITVGLGERIPSGVLISVVATIYYRPPRSTGKEQGNCQVDLLYTVMASDEPIRLLGDEWRD